MDDVDDLDRRASIRKKNRLNFCLRFSYQELVLAAVVEFGVPAHLEQAVCEDDQPTEVCSAVQR